MKKIVSVIIFCLMLTGFAQIVYGWGATLWVPKSSELPAGWMIIKVGWDEYKIIDLNNAPYGTEVVVSFLDNLPKDWVSLGGSGSGYKIKCLIHDYTAPTVPSNLLYTITWTSVTLSWQSSTDLVGVTGYNIYQDNIKIASTTTTYYTVTGLTPNTGYNFAVTATDAENESAASTVAVTTSYDSEAPTSPTDLICAEKYDTSLKLSWNAATDNVEVTGYYIFKDGVKIGTTQRPSYTVSNLEHNSTYVFLIKAYDTTGNTSSSNNPSLAVLMDSNLSVVPYCVGCYYNDRSEDIPCYWQGNTRIDLAEDATNDAHGNSLCINGSAVYTAGYYDNGSGIIPCYWQGTTRIDLPTKGYGGYASSMCVSGGIIYTAGHVFDGTKYIPCYWKGSTRVDLAGDGIHDSRVNSICVSGDIVYTAGYYDNGSRIIPCYWEGSTRVDLAGDGIHDADVNSIYANGDTVYTAGRYYNGSKDIPCYWKGSTRVDLAGDGIHNAYALSICVNGNIVYTAGRYCDGSKDIPCYWKGSTRVDLVGDGINDAYACSICVNGDTVYTAGCYYTSFASCTPCYWNGTTRVDLGTCDGKAKAIFIPLTCN